MRAGQISISRRIGALFWLTLPSDEQAFCVSIVTSALSLSHLDMVASVTSGVFVLIGRNGHVDQRNRIKSLVGMQTHIYTALLSCKIALSTLKGSVELSRLSSH